jgi:hypothetical protein
LALTQAASARREFVVGLLHFSRYKEQEQRLIIHILRSPNTTISLHSTYTSDFAYRKRGLKVNVKTTADESLIR